MTKSEFITHLAKRIKCNDQEAEHYFSHCIEALKAVWMNGEELTIPGFGKLFIRKKPDREVRHPQTGARLLVEAKSVPVFKPGLALKMYVNNALK